MVHDHGLSVRLPLLIMAPRLRGSNNVTLVLNGTRPEQHLPVRLAGFVSECRRYQQNLGTPVSQRTVQLLEGRGKG